MENDKPISKISDDRFNRKNFILALANQVQQIDSINSFVIGLYGEWGSGKTSIIKLVDEELRSLYFFTAYFNPWRYKSEDILLQDLFALIINAVKSDKKLKNKIQELGELLDEYSQYISFPKINILGIEVETTNTVRGLSKGIGRTLKGDNTLENKKEKINNILSDLALPLVIFIDDVDRLDNNEIKQLFRLIKLTADFNKLIYIIAFDESIVSKALSSNYGSGTIEDGMSFLEKIIQLPIRIPYSNENERFEYTISIINEWLDKSKISTPQKYQEDFVITFKSLHKFFIITPRDSKRLLNSISFTYNCLKNEISIYDVILLETIRIFAPAVFNELIAQKNLLFLLNSGENGYPLTKDLNENGKSFKAKLTDYQYAFNAIEESINFMFPCNDIFNIGWNVHRGEKRDDLFTHQRVGIKKYFDRYIEFKIGKEDISDIEFKEIIKKINTQNYSSLQEIIENISNKPIREIYNLFVHNRYELTDLGKSNIASILCTEKVLEVKRTFDERIMDWPTKFCIELISELNNFEKIKTIKQIITENKNHEFKSHFLSRLSNGYGKEGAHKLDSKNIDPITSEYISSIQNQSIHEILKDVDNKKNMILFELISLHGDIKKLKTDLVKEIEHDPYNVVLIMKSLINMVYINFSPIGVYSNEIRHSNFEEIEKYLSYETIKTAALKIYPDLKTLIKNQKSTDTITDIDKSILFQYLNWSASSVS